VPVTSPGSGKSRMQIPLACGCSDSGSPLNCFSVCIIQDVTLRRGFPLDRLPLLGLLKASKKSKSLASSHPHILTFRRLSNRFVFLPRNFDEKVWCVRFTIGHEVRLGKHAHALLLYPNFSAHSGLSHKSPRSITRAWLPIDTGGIRRAEGFPFTS